MVDCPKKRYRQAANIYIQAAKQDSKLSLNFQGQLFSQLDYRLSHQNIQDATDELIKKYFKRINFSQRKSLLVYNFKHNSQVTENQDNFAQHTYSNAGQQIIIQAVLNNNASMIAPAFNPQQMQEIFENSHQLFKIGKMYLIPNLKKQCYEYAYSKNGQTFYKYSQIADVTVSQSIVTGKISFWQKTKEGLTRLTSGQAVYDFFYNMVKNKILKQNQEIKKRYFKDKQCLKSCKSKKTKNQRILERILKDDALQIRANNDQDLIKRVRQNLADKQSNSQDENEDDQQKQKQKQDSK